MPETLAQPALARTYLEVEWVPKHTFRMHALCVPASSDATRLIVVGARSFARLPVLKPSSAQPRTRLAVADNPEAA